MSRARATSSLLHVAVKRKRAVMEMGNGVMSKNSICFGSCELQNPFRKVATIVTPETLLAWHRKLIADKYDGSLQNNSFSTAASRGPLSRHRRMVCNEDCGCPSKNSWTARTYARAQTS